MRCVKMWTPLLAMVMSILFVGASLATAQNYLEIEAGGYSDYVARTGFHTGATSFQGHVLYARPWNKTGGRWYVGTYGFAGGGFFSEEVDFLGGVVVPTSQHSYFDFLVSYDELEPTGLGNGDLVEIVPSHHWVLGSDLTVGVGVDWLQPVSWFHGAPVPYLELEHQRQLSAHCQLGVDVKVGYDAGEYMADVGFISLAKVDLSYALNNHGLSLKPTMGMFAPLSGSIHDRDCYFYGGVALNQAITW